MPQDTQGLDGANTGAAYWDAAVPNFLAHRVQLRGIAERAAHNGRVHGGE